MQVYCAGRILILLHKPSLKGMREYMANQKLLAKAVDTVCGIAMTLTDDASSLVSSQCLYIGMPNLFLESLRMLKLLVAGLCIQDVRQREAVISLIDACHRRTGWPTRSLSHDLREEWQQSDVE